MKKHFVLSVVFVLLLSACDERYDFSKMDKEINVLQNTDMPLPGTDTLSMGKLIPYDANSIIRYFRKGDLIPTGCKEGEYYAYLNSSNVETTVKLPDIQPIGSILKASDVIFDLPALSDAESFKKDILEVTFNSIGNILDFTRKIEDPENSVVKEVRSLKGEGTFTLSFNIGRNEYYKRLWIKEGTAVSFPGWLEVEPLDAKFRLERKDGFNNIVLTEDVAVVVPGNYKVSVKVVGFDCTKFNEKSHYSKGTLVLYDKIDMNGQAYIKKQDINFPAPAMHVDIPSTASLDQFKVASAEAIISPDKQLEKIHFNPVEIKPEDIPEFLRDETNVYDLNGIFCTYMEYDNSLPLNVFVEATIASIFNDGKTVTKMSIPKFTFEPQKKDYSYQYLSMTDTDTGKSLFYKMPKTVYAESFKVYLPDEFTTFRPGESFNLKCNCGFIAPLVFGKDLSMTYHYRMKLKFDFGVESKVRDLIIAAAVENSLPMQINVSPVILDRDMNPLEDVTVSSDITLPAADSKPSKTDMKIGVTSNHSISAIGGIDFVMHISDGKDIALNSGQGIIFSNFNLHTDNGITLNFSEKQSDN